VKLLSKYEFHDNLLYSRDHIWVRVAEEENPHSKVYVGLTDFAQQNVGPVEFVRILPKGRYVSRGHPFGSIESGRRIVLLRAPVLGLIQEVNDELRERPELINSDPYGHGWVAAFQPFQLEDDKKELVSKPEELERLVATRLR
jgi:glycine cleavage system H protein